MSHGDAKPLIDPYTEKWENDFGAEGLFQDLYSGQSTDTGIPSTTPGSRINPAVLKRSDTAEGDNMELAHRALPMDGLHVETPARKLPPTHPFESDGLFYSIVLDSAGEITRWKIHNKRSLFPTVLTSRLTKVPSVFKCPLPGCKVFTVGIDIRTVYKHLDDDKHGIAFGKQNNMVLCPTNCGYGAISDHHLTMYHMPKCPSIKAAEIQPDHRFKCSHCDAADMLLLDFATHWDLSHANHDWALSDVSCDHGQKRFAGSTILFAVHYGHFRGQSDATRSEHFRLLDQHNMLWEAMDIQLEQQREELMHRPCFVADTSHLKIMNRWLYVDHFKDVLDINVLPLKATGDLLTT